jgi:hypothetical protein
VCREVAAYAARMARLGGGERKSKRKSKSRKRITSRRKSRRRTFGFTVCAKSEAG